MDKYKELDIVGEGTYGMVVKCEDETTGQIVAIKKLKNTTSLGPIFCKMIVRELNLLRILNHNHVVSVIEVFRYHGYIYMVFPFMLYNLYKHKELNGGTLTLDRTKECMYQVSRILIFF